MYEIERKFLIDGDFRPFVESSSHIVQGYISRTPGRTVRVRIRDNRAYLTIKGPSLDGGLKRIEWEKEIPVEEARVLMTLCEPPIIDKHRHLVPFEGHIFEVDEFHGVREGLILAEVELSSEDESFARPDWLGREVTGDRQFYNSAMK